MGLIVYAQGPTATEKSSTLHFRARILQISGQAPSKHNFSIHFGSASTEAQDGTWSPWISYGLAARADSVLANRDSVNLSPVIIGGTIGGLSYPAAIEAEIILNESGERRTLQWELFGPNFAVMFWRDSEKRPHASTMAEYNRRYWKDIQGLQIPDNLKPKKFLLVDRFIGGDDDWVNWMDGMKNLSSIGVNVMVVPPRKPLREALTQSGLQRTAWAVYSPPGYAFPELPGAEREECPAAWADALAKSFTDQGFAPSELALFAMSDEPGWYYPAQYSHAAARSRFHQYLQSNALTPGDVGQIDWTTVEPLGHAEAKNLPSKRLFYWTQRFFSWDSERYFADCTRELERVFYPGLPVATNWNFFSGRLYVPGPAANNRDKLSPDAAMGGQDWFEFGRVRGGTELWTEDWFSDTEAYQWSFYAAKLRCAAEKSGVNFGGYVVPRASGDREDGLMQKILTLVGSGGKAVESYVFGPEYTFPGNCYSDRPNVLRRLAKTYRMIGAAEDVLWPGKRPAAQVAILSPRSAELWDAPKMLMPFQIQDATNTNLNSATVDYMAEVADLYLAFQHANLPVDFVDEDSLSRLDELANYRALYITEPNIPEEGQRVLVRWVRAGGTLVTVMNAGAMDRYDEPCSILASAGFTEKDRERLYIRTLESLYGVGSVSARDGKAFAYGVRGASTNEGREVTATFEDEAPATMQRQVGKGTIVHFSWWPGLSYARSRSTGKAMLPWNYSSVIRDWIVAPALAAGVEVPVKASIAMVETPLLLSKAGAAITVLNWNNEPIQNLELTVRVAFQVRTVASVLKGPIDFKTHSHLIRCSIPLNGADIITLRP